MKSTGKPDGRRGRPKLAGEPFSLRLAPALLHGLDRIAKVLSNGGRTPVGRAQALRIALARGIDEILEEEK